jgi:hypothetical protein
VRDDHSPPHLLAVVVAAAFGSLLLLGGWSGGSTATTAAVAGEHAGIEAGPAPQSVARCRRRTPTRLLRGRRRLARSPRSPVRRPHDGPAPSALPSGATWRRGPPAPAAA